MFLSESIVDLSSCGGCSDSRQGSFSKVVHCHRHRRTKICLKCENFCRKISNIKTVLTLIVRASVTLSPSLSILSCCLISFIAISTMSAMVQVQTGSSSQVHLASSKISTLSPSLQSTAKEKYFRKICYNLKLC